MDSAGTILLLYLALLTFSPLDGRIYYNTIHINGHSHLTNLMERGFGFLTDGEIHYSMSCADEEEVDMPHFWLRFCGAADARELTRLPSSQLSVECERLARAERGYASSKATRLCDSQRLQHNTSLALVHQYSYSRRLHNAFYSILLLHCYPPPGGQGDNNRTLAPPTQCPSSLLALNPGNVQLSSDEIPLPVIYTIINLFWATLVGAWFFNWVIYFKFSNRLHQLISCAPIFKVILVVLVLLWWQEIANTGIEPTDISSIRVFVKSMEDSLLFITMMVISEGWGVIRCQIKHYRWTSLILLFLLFATSLMCVHWVHRYFLAFSICCVVFIMYKTLKWTSHNIDLLRRWRRKIRRFVSRHNLRYKANTTLDNQLLQKLHIYHKFRVVCATFSMIYAIAITLATFLTEYSDIKALTFEIPKLLVYTSIGVIFRLRNFEPYDTIELVPPKENVVVMELPDVCYGQVDPHVTLGIPLHFKVEKETQTPRRRWRAPII